MQPVSLFTLHFSVVEELTEKKIAAFREYHMRRQVLEACEITAALAPGSVSTGGKFRSLQVAVRVKDRAELVRLDRELRAVAGVRMVL